MDSFGINENNSPVIFEYKRSQNENVINQGLFYLDLLLHEHLNTPTVKPIIENNVNDGNMKNSTQKSHVEKLAAVSDDLKSLYYAVCDFIESLGDDIVSNQLKLYLAYK